MTLGEEKSGADMSEGYIKLWRKSLDTGMIKNHSLWALWTWCLLKASWQPIKLWVGKREIELQPGQFIFGRLRASEETGLSEQTIRTCMYNLVNAKNLTIKVTNKFSIITICNWETYQGNGISYNQQTNQPLTSNQPATNHKQEVKKVRSKEENTSSPDGDGYSKSFLIFWSLYPKKIGKMAAFKSWKKINSATTTPKTIIDALKNQISVGHFKPDFIPNPATWINQHRWEDEIETTHAEPKRNML